MLYIRAGEGGCASSWRPRYGSAKSTSAATTFRTNMQIYIVMPNGNTATTTGNPVSAYRYMYIAGYLPAA
jgi:hypothetical protein